MRERVRLGRRERLCVSVCVRERERGTDIVCVCVRQRERERLCACVNSWACEYGNYLHLSSPFPVKKLQPYLTNALLIEQKIIKQFSNKNQKTTCPCIVLMEQHILKIAID